MVHMPNEQLSQKAVEAALLHCVTPHNIVTLDLPPPATLPGTNIRTAHVFLGDAAFPLNVPLMRPYPDNYTNTSTLAISLKEYTLLCSITRNKSYRGIEIQLGSY